MDRCPYIKSVGDVDFCKESERPSGRIKQCLLMSGATCKEWEEIQREWDKAEQEILGLVAEADTAREAQAQEEHDWDMFRDRY